MKSYGAHAQRRDKNEKPLREYGEAQGCVFLPGGEMCDHFMWSPVTLCISIVEFKNPDEYWELTPSEIKWREFCQRRGIAYNIVEFQNDLMDVIHYGEVRAAKCNSRTETRAMVKA